MSDQVDAIRRIAKAAVQELRAASTIDEAVRASARLYRAASSEGFNEAIGADGEKAILRALSDKACERSERKVAASISLVGASVQLLLSPVMTRSTGMIIDFSMPCR